MNESRKTSSPANAVRALGAVAVAVVLLSACTDELPEVTSEGAPIALTVRLVGSQEVELSWRSSAPGPAAAGYVVEYAHERDGEYVTLAFVPAPANTFLHSRLVPDTAFFYRLRGYHGPATNNVAVSLPEELSAGDYAASYDLAEDYQWAEPATEPGRTGALVSLKAASVEWQQLAPLRADLISTTVSGFKLTWADGFTDEEGFLLERQVDAGDFQVVAVVDRDINALGWALAPPERAGVYRMRAYYYGRVSNIEGVITGPGEL